MKSRLMKSRLIVIGILALLMAGCSKLPDTSGSFRDQICELVQLRDSGQISDEEYHHSRRNLLNRMLH